MKKYFLLTLSAICLSIASFALGPITGASSGCLGASAYLMDSTDPGGTWSSSNTSIATIVSTGTATGYLTTVSAGTVTITYTLGSAYVTHTYTVNPAPAAITGASSVCIGSSIALSDATTGGVWSTSASAIASVSATTGVVYGYASGYATIYYTLGGGCSAAHLVAVSIPPYVDSTISGPSIICVGSAGTFTDVTTGGTWSSSNTAVATISSGGVATGVTTGYTLIAYTVTGACGTSSSAYKYVNVSSTTAPATISGSAFTYVGATTILSGSVYGGVWASGTPSVATIDAATGVVTGVSAGTSVISYTITGCGGAVTTVDTVTVAALNGISGKVYFGSGAYFGTVKLWLITYNASSSMLQAVDSTLVYCAGDSVYYQFLGAPTDSYRIKAAVIDSSGATTGYIPTYHTSSYYWYSATVLGHTVGTSDINQHINMAYGTVTTGPGFIGGNVTTGANRGTTGGVPVKGLMMYVINTTTGQIMQHIRTNALGNYSFSGLPVGSTYFVFPDSLNYKTTAYSGIALTTAVPTMTAANFIQHTISKTITPITAAVENVTPAATSLITYPDPVSGKLTIQWNAIRQEAAQVTISDVVGRAVSVSNINLQAGVGTHQIDLSTLKSGMYIISVKSVNLQYTNKIQVQN